MSKRSEKIGRRSARANADEMSMRVALAGLFLLVPMIRGEDRLIEISLPTENDALFRGGGEEFYQYIEREFQGEKSWPWEGGRYGYVRNPVSTSAGPYLHAISRGH